MKSRKPQSDPTLISAHATRSQARATWVLVVIGTATLLIGAGGGFLAGKGTTKTLTETETHVVTQRQRVLVPPSGGDGTVVRFSRYLNDILASEDNIPTQSVTFRSNEPGKLGNNTYSNAAVFLIETGLAPPYTLEAPADGAKVLYAPKAGVSTKSQSRDVVTLDIYADRISPNTSLYHRTFRGPSDIAVLRANVGGATKLIFKWTDDRADSIGVSSDDPLFVLADAELIG
jgi:hypothetical protein